MPKRWTIALLCLIILAAACQQAQPEAKIRDLVSAVEKWDTEKMASLYCPSQQDKARGGMFLAGAFLGLTSLVGIEIKGIKIEDARYETRQTGDNADVRLTGRIVVGFPIGSQNLDTTFSLAKEEGNWCITN